MNGSTTQIPPALAGHIHDRIGPIFDPAFLKLIPKDVLKEITVIRIRAVQSTIQAELAAAEQLAKAVEKARF